ncbi:MAG TPA: DNA polymerase I, partial [Sphingobacteriaceae bacterium]|nr:DNA polymerase I [Sphingobacteriaceae bacterium]
KLATIILDVPIDLNVEVLVLEEPDKEVLEPLFAELEFRTLGRRVFGDEFNVNESKAAEGGQMDMFNVPKESSSAIEEAVQPIAPGKNITNTEHDYQLVDTFEKIDELVNLLNSQSSFAFDTETTGLDPHDSDLVGMSFSFEAGKAWYVPLDADRDKCMEVLNKFKPVFENENIEKIGQNIKYDILVLAWHDVEVRGDLFDTMIAHYLIDADSRHSMDVLAENYLGYTCRPISDLIGKKGKKQGNMRDVALEVISDYACEDADITFQLSEVFRPLLKEYEAHDLAQKVEFPLVYVLAQMERVGVFVDVPFLQDYSIKLEKEVLEAEKSIYEKAGVKFNIASPKQLGEVLFDKLQLDPKAKKTKTGQYQTGEDVLLALASKSDIVQDILNHRQLRKLKSTYVDALPELIHSVSKVIHTSFNQAVATTGRLSSTNPNLQNIPIKTERGREVRKAFIPRKEGHTLISADYSQIELRLVAEISKDPAMREAFMQGLDIHTATAARVYGIPLDEVNSDMRRNAKAVNFGIIYGQSAFGLSQALGIPRREAAEIIEQYFIQYPGIKDYMDTTIQFARENGYVETLLKRRRYLRDINSANATIRGFAERNAINAPIQGSAAEMIKIAMINIHQDIIEKGLKGRMTTQVHDELIFDVPDEEVEIFKEIIHDRMKNAMVTEIPIVVEVGVGLNWLEAH